MEMLEIILEVLVAFSALLVAFLTIGKYRYENGYSSFSPNKKEKNQKLH